MRRGLTIMVVAGILALFSSQKAKADIIFEYSLSGVTFSDGGTATGTFSWDKTTGAYSNIHIATTSGSLFDGSVGPGSGGTPYTLFKLVSPSDTRLELVTFDFRIVKVTDETTVSSDLTLDFGESLNDGASTVGLDIVGGTPVSSEALLYTNSASCNNTDPASGCRDGLLITTGSYGPGTRNITGGVLNLTVFDSVGTPLEVLPTFTTVDDAVAATVAPEPSSLLLLGTGLLALGLLGLALRFRRRIQLA
jgi:hypothetical protein